MRLEVLISNDDPEIYSLNKPEIFIGSGDSSDIIISHQGVTRRHLKISIVNDQYYVTDQGSTNGTFINEERLIPGRRVEFTSFFPVRLGSNVLLSLLSDEESESELLKDFIQKDNSITNPTPEAILNETTRIIRPQDLKKAKTQELINSRKKVISKKQKQIVKKHKKKNKMLLPALLSLSVLCAGYFLNDTLYVEKTEIQNKIVPPSQQTATKGEFKKPLIPNEVPKEKLQSYFYDIKCTTLEEMEYCNSTPVFSEKFNGVIRVGTSFVFLIEENPWLTKALSVLPGDLSVQEMMEKRVDSRNDFKLSDVYVVALLEFFTTSKISIDKYVNTSFYFVFYNIDSQNSPVIGKVIAMNSSYHSKVSNLYNEMAQKSVKQYGIKPVAEIKEYIYLY
jgi:pSer/pThr/pTyr-binding forkhead associated (FHA) protein